MYCRVVVAWLQVLDALPYGMPCMLPPKSPGDERKTLVLDLDETLVHCSIDGATPFDWKFDVEFHGTSYAVSVRTRPHLQRFLAFAAQHFEVVVFTASQVCMYVVVCGVEVCCRVANPA
jgi:hypothetical protein